MQLRELEKWLTPSEVARELTARGQRISHQAIIRRLNEGKHYRAVYTHQGWLVDPKSVKS